MIIKMYSSPATLRFASGLTPSLNKRLSGFAMLRPNPSLPLRTSDTRKTLGEILVDDLSKQKENSHA